MSCRTNAPANFGFPNRFLKIQVGRKTADQWEKPWENRKCPGSEASGDQVRREES